MSFGDELINTGLDHSYLEFYVKDTYFSLNYSSFLDTQGAYTWYADDFIVWFFSISNACVDLDLQ